MRARTRYNVTGTHVTTEKTTVLGGFKTAILNPNDANLHPVKFVRGLAEAAEHAGAMVFEQTPALTLDTRTVKTIQGIIRAKHVILALESDTPRLTKEDGFYSREGALVTKPLSKAVLKRLNWEGTGMLWNAARNYLTIRKIDTRLFVCNRAPLRDTSVNRERHAGVLLNKLHQTFPQLRPGDLTPSYYWSGRLFFPYTLQPVIKHERGISTIFGHGGLGLTDGTMAGREAVERIVR